MLMMSLILEIPLLYIFWCCSRVVPKLTNTIQLQAELVSLATLQPLGHLIAMWLDIELLVFFVDPTQMHDCIAAENYSEAA